MEEMSDKLSVAEEIGEICKAQTEVNEYLEAKNIPEIFNFLRGHLLLKKPEDPVEFLATLLMKCVSFREGRAEPPLLLKSEHIEEIFKALDPLDAGTVTMYQYRTGMMALGIPIFEEFPPTDQEGNVQKQTFIDEAKQRLVTMLMEMLDKNKEDHEAKLFVPWRQ